MLNIFKNPKKYLEQLPKKIISLNSKALVYLGLTAYWTVILAGTFLQIG